MLPNLESSYISFILSEDEQKVGSTFGPEQRAVLQNEIALAAEEKLNLTFDPQNPLGFAQQEAELQGKIGILKYLLSLNPPVVFKSESQ